MVVLWAAWVPNSTSSDLLISPNFLLSQKSTIPIPLNKSSMLATSVFPSKPSICFQLHHRHMSLRSAIAQSAPPAAAAVDRESLYEVLRVKHNASQTEIKTAYRTLAKIYHPDATSRFMNSSICSSEDRNFIEIHNAYSTLSDPEARAVYDLKLITGSQRRRSPSSSFSGFRRPGWEKYNPIRRWETDQCW